MSRMGMLVEAGFLVNAVKIILLFFVISTMHCRAFKSPSCICPLQNTIMVLFKGIVIVLF